MSLRTITYNFNGTAVSPDTVQYGGVRYEDNATLVKFVLEADFKSKILEKFSAENLAYRIDFNGAVSGYNPSENLEEKDNVVCRKISIDMTAAGEQITAVLVVTVLNAENEVLAVVSSIPVKIYFDNVQREEDGGIESAENLSAIENKTNEFCALAQKFSESAKNSAAYATAAADGAEEALQKTEELKAALEDGTEFVFLGGGANGCVSVDLVVDDAMSSVSENPVKNRAVFEAIDNVKQELKEYTDVEIATFDFIKIVDSLDENGLPNRLYLVPKSDAEGNDLFDEYIWANGKWEFITTKQIEIDLTPYVKKSDVVDYIVEQGTSGIWTYRKWNSGIFECWGSVSKEVTAFEVVNSQLNLYLYSWEVSLPFESTTEPIGSGSSRWYFGNWVNVAPLINADHTLDGSKVTVMLYQTQADAGNRIVYLKVRGTWK